MTIRASLHESLVAHLGAWGLKRFTSADQYDAWQRQALSRAQLATLHALMARKRCGGAADEAAFYDAAADASILPVLYSQRYEYYAAIGPRVAARLRGARSVLDFGCGVGILTTFYAAQHPETTVVGVDPSPASLARGRDIARTLGIRNVRFEPLDERDTVSAGSFDAIAASHVLLQAEQDPGLPSRDWMTFERDRDEAKQQAFEARTGLGPKLDRLCRALAPAGRMIVFEKTRALGRRVPFQRALAARGLRLMEPPEAIRYHVIEEATDDGPLYVLGFAHGEPADCDERPEPDDGPPLSLSGLAAGNAPAHGEPLYENHRPSAQAAWERLEDKRVRDQRTTRAADGQALHVEWGYTGPFVYLYCANTFDQRQLVVMPHAQLPSIQDYYDEILRGL